ncbi:TPA: cell filamentation protein Fic [Candidatus Dependentiae bacterium]|nr:MAG: Filamentation induced by cAMP protein Fic [candidate division TM6 bacterium GW2011_GWE2_31_21]KKP53000.1 MAG: Filamentation induced by cAMP protein Fic [candidate division TM6 bacterium GW2011_GWF2_33_332]HBS47763.1 cell filamentation protein Fic [Candidatus Dependentiae bacterium]HBZ73261.1 cell filamentation protein Fic [Candidatus Dependentiae bacterium]
MGVCERVSLICQKTIEKIDELKKQIERLEPLSFETLKMLKEYFKIGLTYSSNAIEGNSLTETETKIILEDGITIGGKTLKEHFEVVGHGEAYNFLYDLIKKDEISQEDILTLHKLFYYRIDEKNAGIYRKIKVIITGTDFIPPSPDKVPQLMSQFIKQIPQLRKSMHPVEFAAILHKEFVEIHPFVDGNGRTARLLMNLVLMQTGYVITIIPPVLRRDYMDCLRAANKGDSSLFVSFISNMVYEAMKDYLRLINSLE